jgi:hypothetical protein
MHLLNMHLQRSDFPWHPLMPLPSSATAHACCEDPPATGGDRSNNQRRRRRRRRRRACDSELDRYVLPASASCSASPNGNDDDDDTEPRRVLASSLSRGRPGDRHRESMSGPVWCCIGWVWSLVCMLIARSIDRPIACAVRPRPRVISFLPLFACR